MKLNEVVIDKFLLKWLLMRKIDDEHRQIAEKVYYKVKERHYRLVYTRRLIDVIIRELRNVRNEVRKDTYVLTWLHRLFSLFTDSNKVRLVNEIECKELEKIKDENDREMLKSTIGSLDRTFITTDEKLQTKIKSVIAKYNLNIISPHDFIKDN